MSATEIDMIVRCSPWTHDVWSKADHCVRVDLVEYPRVRVWDPIGKIYTVCHSLTPLRQARIIRDARKLADSRVGT